MKNLMNIPQKLHVGFQERSGTYAGKLSYIIYTDEKNKIRKEASWNSWKDNKIATMNIENVNSIIINYVLGRVDINTTTNYSLKELKKLCDEAIDYHDYYTNPSVDYSLIECIKSLRKLQTLPDIPVKSVHFLNKAIKIQQERGTEYNKEEERSFNQVVTAFNAVTGHKLKGSDVCLLLAQLKLVRQYSDPDSIHDDSLLDFVSYASLWAEELTTELKDK
jgi:hypothetical protein